MTSRAPERSGRRHVMPAAAVSAALLVSLGAAALLALAPAATAAVPPVAAVRPVAVVPPVAVVRPVPPVAVVRPVPPVAVVRPGPAVAVVRPGPARAQPASVPGTSVVGPPGTPGEDGEGGGGLGWLVAAATVVAGIGAGLLLASRRRPAAGGASGRTARTTLAWGTHGTPTAPAPPPAGRTVADVVRAAADVALLTAALREIADRGPSPAIRQQVRRLLDDGRPGREDLVEACVRYRDQLAGRDPALADGLLAGLAGVGVTEVVADGEPFDPHRHRSMDVRDTPHAHLRDVVAVTTRRGYLDGHRVVRLPEVVVYRYVPRGGRGGPPPGTVSAR